MASLNGGRKFLTGYALLTTLFSAVCIAPVTSMELQEGVVTESLNDYDNNNTILCYQCNSWSDEGCVKLHANATSADFYLKECVGDFEGQVPFCRKTVQAIKNHAPRIIRSCGWLKHEAECYHTDDDHHVENVCQCYTDACNTASSRYGNVAFSLAATLLALVTLVLHV